MVYLAKIYVMLKESVLDPQGQAVLRALHNLHHQEVQDVRIGRYIELKIDVTNRDDAEKRVTEYCDTFLANGVIENYRFDLESAG